MIPSQQAIDPYLSPPPASLPPSDFGPFFDAWKLPSAWPITQIDSPRRDLPSKTIPDLCCDRNLRLRLALYQRYFRPFSVTRWPITADPYLRHLTHLTTNILRHTPLIVATGIVTVDSTYPDGVFIYFWPFLGQPATGLDRQPPQSPPPHRPPLIPTGSDPSLPTVGVFRRRAPPAFLAAVLPVYPYLRFAQIELVCLSSCIRVRLVS